ncbi:SapC family protein [Aliikangiella maris]|uniref:SapC family protein n=2 Tax=Aliikangiella maris TaxID=3162458 RepID=A0ABV2BYV8_9GAMM
MQSNLAQLNNKDHKNTKLKVNQNFNHLANHHIAPVIMHEIPNAASDLPVVFVKNSENDDFLCVALLGLKEGENLLVKEGVWQGPFIPAGYTHYPLALVPHPEDQNKYSITIVTDSEAVSESEGEALYDEEGKETEYLSKRRRTLENYYQCAVLTRNFIKMLQDLELLEEQGFSFEVGEDKRNITGVYVVNEKKLNELSDEQFLDLRQKGLLAPIYAHLISLKQTQRLVGRIATK